MCGRKVLAMGQLTGIRRKVRLYIHDFSEEEKELIQKAEAEIEDMLSKSEERKEEFHFSDSRLTPAMWREIAHHRNEMGGAWRAKLRPTFIRFERLLEPDDV